MYFRSFAADCVPVMPTISSVFADSHRQAEFRRLGGRMRRHVGFPSIGKVPPGGSSPPVVSFAPILLCKIRFCQNTGRMIPPLLAQRQGGPLAAQVPQEPAECAREVGSPHRSRHLQAVRR